MEKIIDIIDSIAYEKGLKVSEVEEALKGMDNELIKQKTEVLQQAVYEVSAKMYEQNQQQSAKGQPEAEESASADDSESKKQDQGDVVDADFEERAKRPGNICLINISLISHHFC